MTNRVMESRLLLVKGVLDGENGLVKEIVRKFHDEDKSVWGRKLRAYLEKVNISLGGMEVISRSDLRTRIRKVDKQDWIADIDKRKSLKMYRAFKTDIGDENLYDNRRSSELLYLARTNALELNRRTRYKRENRKECDLCEAQVEDHQHFLFRCQPMELARGDQDWVGRILFQ